MLTRRLKNRDPSIIEAMKQANIRPRGRLLVGLCIERRAGVQKKTKRYMEPSKNAEARPRVKMRGEVRTCVRLRGLAGTEDVDVWELLFEP